MKPNALPLALLTLAVTASAGFAAPRPDREKAKAEITATEAAFCRMGEEKGLPAAFEHFAAAEVAFLDPDPRQWRGLPAVHERMKGTPPDLKLTWSPIFVEVSEDATLGYDYGRYEMRRRGPDGQDIIRGGFFLTIWKRQADGSWRYVMDNGTPDKPAARP